MRFQLRLLLYSWYFLPFAFYSVLMAYEMALWQMRWYKRKTTNSRTRTISCAPCRKENNCSSCAFANFIFLPEKWAISKNPQQWQKKERKKKKNGVLQAQCLNDCAMLKIENGNRCAHCTPSTYDAAQCCRVTLLVSSHCDFKRFCF